MAKPISDTLRKIADGTLEMVAFAPEVQAEAMWVGNSLPPLPPPEMPHGSRDYFSAGQMHAYAATAIAACSGDDAALATDCPDGRDAARYRLIRAGFGDSGPELDLHNALVDGGEKLDAALDKLLEPRASRAALAAQKPAQDV